MDNGYMECGLVKLSGSIEGVIFSNEDTGYAICDLGVVDENGKEQDIVTILGIMPYVSDGDNVIVYGRWVHNAKYGRQFKVEQWEKSIPAGTTAILRYLSSRAVKGIGPKTAKKIVDEFGEETFDVIENHCDWLSQIPGISRTKAESISEDFKSKMGMHSSMMFFRDYFGPSLSVKIYNRWGSKAVEIAKQNPYRLSDEIENIGFEKADAMAQKLGLAKDSEERICSGIRYVLSTNATSNGHTCLPYDKLVETSAVLLGVTVESVKDNISVLLKYGLIRYVMFGNIQYLYSAYSYESEHYIAEKLVFLEKMCVSLDIRDVNAFIRKSQNESGIEYAEMQKKAIIDALQSGVMLLTGGPGTGKTTVVKALIDIFESLGMRVALSAPTGRAAKRLSVSTSREAKTIHRLLEMTFSPDSEEKTECFRRNENDLLEEDVIIVDEASMIDQFLMSALLKAIKPGARIIIIGDADQLPSVGAGNVLKDLISSGRFSTVCLNEIFRQAKQSLIVTNAHAINEGKMPVIDIKDNDFFFLKRETDYQISMTVAELCAKRLPKTYGEMGKSGVQVISPSRKGEAGTENLNVILQNILNPKSDFKKEYRHREIVYREGDKVMQIRNDYELEWEKNGVKGSGVFNGDIGIIEEISLSEQSMVILFDDRRVVYDFSILDELEHAYAITVHKSQGSEYPIVVMPMYNTSAMLLTRNLLYTAVTRAQNMVILVGKENIIEKMVKNNRQAMRYTGLEKILADGEK